MERLRKSVNGVYWMKMSWEKRTLQNNGNPATSAEGVSELMYNYKMSPYGHTIDLSPYYICTAACPPEIRTPGTEMTRAV